MDDPYKCYAKKSGAKDHMSYDSIYTKCPEIASL